MTWKNECVGYYNFQLPDKVETGIYPLTQIITKNILGINSIFGKYYEYGYQGKNVEGKYSNFYYNNYRIMVSEKKSIDINKYKEEVGSLLSEHSHPYDVTNYSPDVFYLTYEKSHSLYINKGGRMYQFLKAGDNGIDKSSKKSLDLSKAPDVYSLLSHFHTRDLYEIPSGQGFCLPYGFIDETTGKAERHMAVTYRMTDHPDVMILFQDASFQFRVPINNDDLKDIKNYDAKDYAKWLWNNIYMLYPNQKRKLLWPRWFTVKMDGRKGVGSFLEVTKKNGEKDYGYLAFVRGNPDNLIEEPDLQVFVSSVSDIAEGHPRMTPDELKALAEHIVNSVKHR
ncbi:hypothetical protein MKU92_004497 [Salmonella enterica]|nr:hypothetical protein [Salmonella enterica]EIZ8585499.1 hypothetical protein [Salmonella enterica subsp. enterica]